MKNAFASISNKLNTLSVNAADKKKALIGVGAGAAVLGSATALIFAEGENAFEEIAKVIAEVFQNFYNAAVGIISVIAIVLIAICLILRMISKDQRKVDSATEWMKRIIITWVVFLFLGNIQKLITGIGEKGDAVTF